MTHPKTHLLRRNTIVGSLVHRVCRVAAVSSAQRRQEHGDAHTYMYIKFIHRENLANGQELRINPLATRSRVDPQLLTICKVQILVWLLQANLISLPIRILMKIYGILLSFVWPLG